jgi:hypothetical protein
MCLVETLDDRITKFKDEIDKWETSILRSPNVDFGVLEKILGLGVDELNQLDASRAASYAYLLSQYAMAVQYETNRLRAFLGWARKVMPTTYDTEARHDKTRLSRMVTSAEYKVEKTIDLSRRIDSMSYAMQLIAKTRS